MAIFIPLWLNHLPMAAFGRMTQHEHQQPLWSPSVGPEEHFYDVAEEETMQLTNQQRQCP